MFAELEEPLISALDEFNILLLAFGQEQESYQQGTHAAGLEQYCDGIKNDASRRMHLLIFHKLWSPLLA